LQLGLWPLLFVPAQCEGLQMEPQTRVRIYKELEFNLRIKPRKRLVREKPEALTVPQGINQVWSMDFMHDQLEDGRMFRLLNVIDDCNREAIGMEIDCSLPSERVIREHKQIISWRGKPEVIQSDNGPEYISAATQTWAQEMGIRLNYIQPGNPQQNAYVERFNWTVPYNGFAVQLNRLVRCARLCNEVDVVLQS